jgi:peroxiredoxin
MSFRDRIKETTQRAAGRMSPELLGAVEDMLRNLAAKDIASGSLKAGDAFPEFELPNSEGQLVSLAELLAKGPLVVSFFRGDWCPFCTAELLAYQDVLPALRELGATLVAITPDTRAALLSPKRKHGLTYQILSDVDYGLALTCGILFNVPDPVRRMFGEVGIDLAARHGTSGCFLPFPATYVVDRAGMIRHAEIDPDFRRRLEPAQAVEILRGLVAS